ncbi:MAG: pseudouridine synthase [Fusobacterium sp.]|uniref:pseudouridine synthase n=1 Tax=Fusobacterium sp. TaxID=68766 RepID=UPI0026DB11AA|nr:pseudouridine synthase [Fusobacterium sp.]MDO4690419.1 pseudouridine synthase [Fusobacterium sp.]
MRINKYLATLGIASRRNIDKLILEGKISVNGKIAVQGMEISDVDEIIIDGKKIEKNLKQNLNEKVYFMLNKPLEVLSSSSDDRGRKTVVDLIKTDKRIFPIGRLDYMTRGLIILTNDGNLFNRLVHPKSEVYKKYYLKVFGELKKSEIEQLKKGVNLEDGKTLPAKINSVKIENNKTSMFISIKEGRNRQIRRMIEKFGYRVLELRREKIGELSLGDLPEGKYRELTKEEIEYLYSL